VIAGLKSELPDYLAKAEGLPPKLIPTGVVGGKAGRSLWQLGQPALQVDSCLQPSSSAAE